MGELQQIVAHLTLVSCEYHIQYAKLIHSQKTTKLFMNYFRLSIH